MLQNMKLRLFLMFWFSFCSERLISALRFVLEMYAWWAFSLFGRSIYSNLNKWVDLWTSGLFIAPDSASVFTYYLTSFLLYRQAPLTPSEPQNLSWSENMASFCCGITICCWNAKQTCWFWLVVCVLQKWTQIHWSILLSTPLKGQFTTFK